MKIHTVCLGDSIRSVAELYGIPESRILFDNEIVRHQRLFPGQTLIIGEPTRTDSVRGGDTLKKIAERNEIDTLTLLQCNPYLALHGLIPSLPLNIAYAQSSQKLLVHAYSDTADDAILEKRLAQITILSVQNVATLKNGAVYLTDRAYRLSALARRFHVLPVLCVDFYDSNGQIDRAALAQILSVKTQIGQFAECIAAAAKSGGFAGVELALPNMHNTDAAQADMFFSELAAYCEKDGLYLLSPWLADLPSAEKTDRKRLRTVSLMPMRNCLYDDDSRTALAAAPIDRIRKVLASRLTAQFAKKLLLDIPTFGLDYTRIENGYHKCVVDAAEVCRGLFPFPEIFFDKKSRTPCARYSEQIRHTSVLHLLYYEDARSLAAKLALVAEYGLAGVSIHSLAYDIPALWLLLNQIYSIVKCC